MDAINASNPFARPAKDLVELLMRRAENLYKEVKPPSSPSSPPQNLLPQDSTPAQYSTIYTETKPSAWQNDDFDFSDYTPPQGQPLDVTQSGTPSTPPNVDLTCGGIIGQYGPVATVVDNVYYTVPDTWDPMIFLERSDSGMANFASNGVEGGYGQDSF
jgi:hypothetical protein